MRKFIYIAAIMALAACSGTIDPEQGGEGTGTGEIPEEFTAPFTLSASLEEVEADGQEFVEFSLKDKYDREMLEDKRTLQSVNIVSDKGIRVPRMDRTVTFIENGTYTFSATYLGTECANKVQVKAVNRAAYEVYHRNVGLFKATSVWCVACPSLANSLHGLSDNTKDHSVVLAFHGDFNYRDPFSVYAGDVALGAYLMGAFGGNGWPTLVYDLDYADVGAAGTSVLENNIFERRVEYPATCGIKVTSVKVEGTSLKVKAALTTSTGGDYDLACAVLCDGLVYDAQGVYSANDDGVFDEVVLTVSSNFIGYSSETGKTLAGGEEMQREFTFDFGEGNVPSDSDLKKYYVAVWGHKKTSDASVMDNIVTCGYGESVDYRYNE